MAYEVPFIPPQSNNLLNPLDVQSKQFALSQAQTQAGRETEQYKQQQATQRALKDIFSTADTTTPEGQADLIRQVGRVDPNTAFKLQADFQKQKLEQAQTKHAEAGAALQAAEVPEHQAKTALDQQEAQMNTWKKAASVTSNLWANYQNDIKGGVLPQKAEEDLRRGIRQELDQDPALKKMVGDNFNPDTFPVQETPKFVQGMQAHIAGQMKPSESPVGKVMDDFNAGRIDAKTRDKLIEKETHIPVPQAIITSNLLTPEAIGMAADQFNLNGTLPPAISRSPVAVAKILDEAAKKNEGKTGVDVAVNRDANKADAKSLANITKQTDMIQSFENTALKNLDMLVDQSKKVKRSDFPLINRAIITGKLGTGDPEAAKFLAIVKPFVDEYAKILSGQTGAAGASDTARREASEIISPYFSPDQISQLKPFITQELNNRTGSLHSQIQEIQNRMHGRVSGETRKDTAPDAAIQHLKSHPELKDAFKAKYGYLPDGI